MIGTLIKTKKGSLFKCLAETSKSYLCKIIECSSKDYDYFVHDYHNITIPKYEISLHSVLDKEKYSEYYL